MKKQSIEKKMSIESREDEILYSSFTQTNGARWTLDENAIRYVKENGFWRPPGPKGLRLSDKYIESSSSPESETPPTTKYIQSGSSRESEITPPATKYIQSGTSRESEATPPATKFTESGSLPESETTPPATKLKWRWSLQYDIGVIFDSSLAAALSRRVPCSISPCSQEDGDYICTSVLETWPELRKTGRFLGPTDAGLTLRSTVMVRDWNGMIERCFVCGPGFLMFKISMKWIAKSIHKIVKDGMDICAPKLSAERAILYFFSGNIADKMHTGHLRSTVIGETLACILEYSRVAVIRKFPEEDVIKVVGFHDETIKLLLCEATSKVMRKCFRLLDFTPIHKKLLKLLQQPFSTVNQKLQGGQFDHADRLFNSVGGTWSSAAGRGNTSDVKELIPEWFYMPEFIENRFGPSELSERFYCSDLTEQQL